MAVSKWSLNAESTLPSSSWEEYAARYAQLLRSIGHAFGGAVSWYLEPQRRAGTELDLSDPAPLLEQLIERQLRDDYGGIMDGGGSHPWIYGRRQLPQGPAEFVLRGQFGAHARPVFVNFEVSEPPGLTLWSYPDEFVANLVASVMAAIDAPRAWCRDRDLLRLISKARASFDVGSHNYVPGPLDASRFPPGARQGPCGKGYLLIVPPGPTPEDTLERMRWVAAATGQA